MTYTFIDPQGNECNSTIPYGGYSYETMQSMAEAGFSLKIDGKKAKFPTRAELAQAQVDTKKR